jgi:hypothetical protein
MNCPMRRAAAVLPTPATALSIRLQFTWRDTVRSIFHHPRLAVPGFSPGEQAERIELLATLSARQQTEAPRFLSGYASPVFDALPRRRAVRSVRDRRSWSRSGPDLAPGRQVPDRVVAATSDVSTRTPSSCVRFIRPSALPAGRCCGRAALDARFRPTWQHFASHSGHAWWCMLVACGP